MPSGYGQESQVGDHEVILQNIKRPELQLHRNGFHLDFYDTAQGDVRGEYWEHPGILSPEAQTLCFPKTMICSLMMSSLFLLIK